MVNWFVEAEKMSDFLVDTRREIHQNPELGFQEYQTAQKVSALLKLFGFEVQEEVAVTGVVGLLKTGKPGPCILVRFDMDALPIQEETGAIYESKNAGKMHACGHDGHVAVGLAVAKLIAQYKEELFGTIKIIFQPAEEGLGGAQKMIEAGVLETPHCDLAVAFHLWNEKPVGWFGVTSGPVMAGSETFSIVVKGRGGHGALPQETRDPVIAAAHLVTMLQTIVSRNVSPLDSAVISTTCIHAGKAHNVIPDKAEIMGTIRSYRPEVRLLLLERMRTMIETGAAALGCQAEIEFKEITPPVVNDAWVIGKILNHTKNINPGWNIDSGSRSMASEDMAYILEKIPGAYLFVGSANPNKGLVYSHHHPKFDIDEAALVNACGLMAASIELLGKSVRSQSA
jgi:amidohydrolase